MPGGNGVNRVDALQGIKTNLGFKMGTVLTAFLRHGDRFPDFGLTIRPVQLSGTTSKELQQWLAEQKIKTIYITPASPWENGFVESFHSRFRDECLNREQLWTLTEARVVIEDFRQDYHTERPHSSLGYDSPRRFAAKTTSPIPGSGPDRQAGPSLRLGLPTTAQPTTSTNVSD
jgi:transposase InsO family protein